jgi:hypothetical protein
VGKRERGGAGVEYHGDVLGRVLEEPSDLLAKRLQ